MEVDKEETQIRADQWHNMDTKQLEQQREILQTRLNLLYDMGGSNPSINAMIPQIINSITILSSIIETNLNIRKRHG